MKIQLEIDIKPFDVPDVVFRDIDGEQSPMSPPLSIPLQKLDEATLSHLCEEFTANVFAKARGEEPGPEPITTK